MNIDDETTDHETTDDETTDHATTDDETSDQESSDQESVDLESVDQETVVRKTIVRNVLVVLGILVLVPVVAVGTVALASGSADGPSAFFGGGPLVAGELVTGPEPDWSFVGDIGTIELELLEPPRSRLIWVADYEGKLYVVSGYMGNFIGRLWKRWPAQAERDGRAVVRIDGKRYERTLVRIRAGEVLEGVSAELGRKYGFGGGSATMESGDTWLFELAPRNASMGGGPS